MLKIQNGNLESFISYLESFFDIKPYLNKRLKSLSGGERAFVSLIAALFSEKELIMLDEPLNMMSTGRRKAAAELIKDVSSKKTIFVISHFAELFTSKADTIIRLKDGKITLEQNKKTSALDKDDKYSYAKTTKTTRILRYIKDDMLLIFIFFFIVFSFQFVTMFAASALENEKKQVDLSNTMFALVSRGVKISEKESEHESAVLDDNIPGISLTHLPELTTDIEMKIYYQQSLSKFGYVLQYFDGDIDGLAVRTYDNIMSDVEAFSFPVQEKPSDACVGKCSSLGEDEVIIGRGILDTKLDLGFDIKSSDFEQTLFQHDFINFPVRLTYIDNSSRSQEILDDLTAEKVLQGDLMDFLADQIYVSKNAKIKELKIVGFDNGSSNFLMRPLDSSLSDYISNIEISQDYYRSKPVFINAGYQDLITAASEANKFLKAKNDFSHHYRVDQSYLIQSSRKKNNFKYDEMLDLLREDEKDIESFEFIYRGYNSDYTDLENKALYFFDDNNVFTKAIEFQADETMNFDPNKDVLVTQNHQGDVGKTVNLFGRNYFVFGSVDNDIYNSVIGKYTAFENTDYLISKSQFESNFKTLIQRYKDYDDGVLESLNIFYKDPRMTEQKRLMIENKLKSTNINGKYEKYLSSQNQEVIDLYLATLANSKKSTRALSISVTVIFGVLMIASLSVIASIVKKNYAVNRFKKSIVRKDIISSVFIGALFLVFTSMLFFTQSYAYQLTVYDLPSLMNFTPLDYEIGHKISNLSMIATAIFTVSIAVYLIARNLNFRNKELSNHDI